MSEKNGDCKAEARSSLEAGIAEWRSYLRRRPAIHSVDVDELEDHLRSQAGALVEAGLTEDEAFLIAVKRIGELDALSREFAREHSERLWKRLVVAPDAGAGVGVSVVLFPEPSSRGCVLSSGSLRRRVEPAAPRDAAVLAAVCVVVDAFSPVVAREDAGAVGPGCLERAWTAAAGRTRRGRRPWKE